MSGWYYERDDGEVLGPLSDDELKHCAERGGIALKSLVMHRQKTKGEWVLANKIGGLRGRIHAAAEAKQKVVAGRADEPSPGPRKPTWKTRMQVARILGTRSLVQMKDYGAAVATKFGDVVNTRTVSNVCASCGGEFTAYDNPGQCPLCGDWQSIVCTSCGLSASARRFVQSKCKCPRCGTKAGIDGAPTTNWPMAALIGMSALAVFVPVAFMVAAMISAPPSNIVPNGVAIVAVLPNPDGQDKGREQVTVENRSGRMIDLEGWRLQDRSGNRFSLGGQIQDMGKLVVTITAPTMSLDNGGDEVFLIDPDGVARSKVVYTADQGASGMQVDFR